MRFTLVVLLLLAAMSPMLGNSLVLDETIAPSFTTSNGVEVIDEIEPNNANTTGQEVYPGDVVRGSVDMWNDAHDWYNVWLEPGQTLLLTLSHASGDGVSMSVWDEETPTTGQAIQARPAIRSSSMKPHLKSVASTACPSTPR